MIYLIKTLGDLMPNTPKERLLDRLVNETKKVPEREVKYDRLGFKLKPAYK
jgi:hypothetical protein